MHMFSCGSTAYFVGTVQKGDLYTCGARPAVRPVSNALCALHVSLVMLCCFTGDAVLAGLTSERGRSVTEGSDRSNYADDDV
jgi:hypothetical protein